MIPENAEQQWFQSLLHGDEAALRYFFQTYFPAVRGYVCAMVNEPLEAEEIASSTFLKLWEERQTLESPTHLVNFLYLVARRAAIGYLRKLATLSVRQQQWLALHENEESENSLDLRDAELLKAMILHEVYERDDLLSPACKKVFDLRYRKGKEAGEIAGQLAISPQTVYNQLAKAIGILRKVLKEKKLLE